MTMKLQYDLFLVNLKLSDRRQKLVNFDVILHDLRCY